MMANPAKILTWIKVTDDSDQEPVTKKMFRRTESMLANQKGLLCEQIRAASMAFAEVKELRQDIAILCNLFRDVLAKNGKIEVPDLGEIFTGARLHPGEKHTPPKFPKRSSPLDAVMI